MSVGTGRVARPLPALRGFRPGTVRLEITRLLRNPRTMLFALVIPAIFFLIFGLNAAYANDRYGSGNESAAVLISMALYGAVLATTSGGAMVSIERATGWSRQLRITPLSPAAYMLIKMASSLVLAGASVLIVYVVGGFAHKPTMPMSCWIETAALVWIGSLVFAAFGLFVGYLLPSENVMQVLGFVLVLFSFAGGLFIPLSQFSSTWRTIAKFTPLYGLNQIVHYPLKGGSFDLVWIANVVFWLLLFTAGAAWRFRRDTARV